MKCFAIRLVMSVGLIAGVAMIMTTSGAAQTPGGPTDQRFSGATLFDDYCKACHGVGAKGDGPLAPLLRRTPANLTLLAQRNGGVFSAEMVSRIIDGRKPLPGHGGGDMPVWGEAFGKTADGADATPAKIAALVAYLQSIQQKP
jgi:mono/diheme cytochrome c family protein